MDDDVVPERQVVAKRPLDEVPAFEVLTDAAEDERREHAAETMAEQGVLPEWRAIEHLPQPSYRLALGITFGVDVGVVLGFGRDVARIEGVHGRAGREAETLAVRPCRAVVDLEQRVAH